MTADDYTQAEVVRALGRIEKGQEDLARKVDGLTDKFVTSDVFKLRIEAVEQGVKDVKDAAATAQASADSRRPSGWTIAVGLAAIVAVATSLIPLLAK